MEIIPAILPSDFAEIEDKVGLVKGLVPLVQVDICDGKFVPSFTWPYKKRDMNYEAILREERGMPYWEDVDYEFDLMVSEPEKVIQDWITAGATRVIVHVESTSAENIESIVSQYSSVIELGLAISTTTSVDAVAPYISDIGRISFIQCMGIEKIGYQGQKFDERVLEQVRSIKTRWPDIMVSVDGGVTIESAPALKEAGTDRLVAGSAIFGSDNPTQEIRRLESI